MKNNPGWNKRITYCMASAGRLIPAAADEVVEVLMALRRFDMGWSGGGAEI